MSGIDKQPLIAAAQTAINGQQMAHTAPISGPGDADPAVQADLFAAEIAQFDQVAIAPPAAKRAGRPPGSLNRSTLQLQRLLLSKGYRDPAEFLASVYTMGTRELAARLAGHDKPELVAKTDVMDAAALQVRAASELMPYFHTKMPVALDIHHGEQPRMLIVMGDMVAEQVKQYQALSGDAAAGSHGDGSHDNGQVIENADDKA